DCAVERISIRSRSPRIAKEDCPPRQSMVRCADQLFIPWGALMHDHCRFGRRHFLKTASAAAVGLGLNSHFSWAANEKTPSPASADVGIARGSNMEEAVRRAVALAGGMDFIKEGQTVLIKPNVTGALKSPT